MANIQGIWGLFYIRINFYWTHKIKDLIKISTISITYYQIAYIIKLIMNINSDAEEVVRARSRSRSYEKDVKKKPKTDAERARKYESNNKRGKNFFVLGQLDKTNFEEFGDLVEYLTDLPK